MKPKPGKLDRKHPAASRDATEDVKDLAGEPNSVRNDIRYAGANRDTALGEADRTGRHYDGNPPEAPDEGSDASKEHEAD